MRPNPGFFLAQAVTFMAVSCLLLQGQLLDIGLKVKSSSSWGDHIAAKFPNTNFAPSFANSVSFAKNNKNYYSSEQSRKKKSTNVTTTAACLYTMDDNHFLIEWLAYHYHAVNLRHLIITYDNESLTTPHHILERWKDRINVKLWTDADFLPDDFAEQVEERVKQRDATTNASLVQVQSLQYHRTRQAAFNVKCLQRHKKENRGWTLMIDIDEYLTFNPDLLYSLEATDENDKGDDIWHRTWHVSDVQEVGSVASILDQIQIPDDSDYPDATTTPCVPVHRVQFSAQDDRGEESNEDKHDDNFEEREIFLPTGFKRQDFQTLRWQHYGGRPVKYENVLGETCQHRIGNIPHKVVVDLRKVTAKQLAKAVRQDEGNPHRPVKAICTEKIYLAQDETPLLAHHYMGTLEQWLYRSGDKRGRGQRLAKYVDMNEGLGAKTSTQLLPWLEGFVSQVGPKEASRLLQGVGALEPYPGMERHVLKLKDWNETAIGSDNGRHKFEVGDVVQANFAGEGEWYWAEVYKVLPNGYYNVFYLADCSHDNTITEDRLRFTGEVDDEEEDYDEPAQLEEIKAISNKQKKKQSKKSQGDDPWA